MPFPDPLWTTPKEKMHIQTVRMNGQWASYPTILRLHVTAPTSLCGWTYHPDSLQLSNSESWGQSLGGISFLVLMPESLGVCLCDVQTSKCSTVFPASITNALPVIPLAGYWSLLIPPMSSRSKGKTFQEGAPLSPEDIQAVWDLKSNLVLHVH